MSDIKNNIDTIFTTASVIANVLNPSNYDVQSQYSDYYQTQINNQSAQIDNGRNNPATSKQ